MRPPDPNSIAAIILAGGVNTIPLYEGYTPGPKALVEFAGKPSIRYVHDALRQSRYLQEICVVGPPTELKGSLPEDWVSFAPSADNPLSSFLGGLARFRDHALVLVVSADLPLLTGTIVDGFVQACASAATGFSDNLFLAIVPRERFTGTFGGTKKQMSQFRDGSFCHGNMMLVQPSFLGNAVAMGRINAMYAARKSPIRSALALGLPVGLAYVVGVHFLHVLTLQQMARLASRNFRMGIVPVAIPHPEVAVDVDEPEDYRLISAMLSRR